MYKYTVTCEMVVDAELSDDFLLELEGQTENALNMSDFEDEYCNELGVYFQNTKIKGCTPL